MNREVFDESHQKSMVRLTLPASICCETLDPEYPNKIIFNVLDSGYCGSVDRTGAEAEV